MNAVTHLEQATTLPTSPAELIFNDAAFERMEQVAKIMASGRSTIPAHLRGSVGDCFAIMMQAARWRMDPYAVAQKTHFINSAIGYEAHLVAAVINNNAPITGRLNYEQFGPWEKVIGKSETRTNKDGKTYRVPGWKPEDEIGCGVRVWATIRGETGPREINLLLSQALTRNSTLWAEDPVQQLCYLAAKRWARRHCPDVIMGVYTPDELDQPAERDITPAPEPAPETRTAAIKDRLKAGGTGSAAPPQKDWDAEAARISNRIDAAGTITELDQAVAEAQKLPDDRRGPLRAKYRQRLNQLKRAAAETKDQEVPPDGVDPATGEINGSAGLTNHLRQDPEYTDWISAIDGCASLDELDGLVSQMPRKTADVLTAEIERRQNEINAG